MAEGKTDKKKAASSINDDHEQTKNDQLKLLQIFPQEIWNLVLDTLSDPETLEKLHYKFPFFQESIKDRRVQFLFPKVWPILLKSGYMENPDDVLDVQAVFENGIPCNVCGRLRLRREYSYVFDVRLVCKTWCASVDNFCENDPVHFKMSHESNLKHFHTWAQTRFGDEDADSTMQHFGSASNQKKNPFLGRWVTLILDNSPDPFVEEFYEYDAKYILQKFGHHFWYCIVYVKDDSVKRINYYRKLRRWLSYLPNLKVLRVRHLESLELSTPPQTRREQNDQQNGLSLMGTVPKLEQLKFLSTENMPCEMFNEILARNTHIEMLEVKKEFIHDSYEIFHHELPNLKQLSVGIHYIDEYEELMETENWALEKLYLDLPRKFFSTWNHLVDILKTKAGGSLKSVVVKLPEQPEMKKETASIIGCASQLDGFTILQQFQVIIGKVTINLK